MADTKTGPSSTYSGGSPKDQSTKEQPAQQSQGDRLTALENLFYLLVKRIGMSDILPPELRDDDGNPSDA